MKRAWLENVPAWEAPGRMLEVGAGLLAAGGLMAGFFVLPGRPPPRCDKVVAEVVAKRDLGRGKRLQVHGCVARGSVERDVGTMRYRFKLESAIDRAAAVIDARAALTSPLTLRQ